MRPRRRESHDKSCSQNHLPGVAPHRRAAARESETRHKAQTQRGVSWNTPELSAMLKDMLQPPSDDIDGFDAPADETEAAAEHAKGSVDEEMDAIDVSE
jgi:hypothetical protein